MSSSTLYVNNLNEKVNRKKVQYVLRTLFSRYGNVVDISMSPALRMKGQAFVTYENGESCVAALEKLQKRPVFKKPLHITRAQTDSDECRRRAGDEKGIEERKRNKAAKMAMAGEKQPKQDKLPFTKAQIRNWLALPANSTLLFQNVPEEDFKDGSLAEKFAPFEGFSKIRPLPFKNLAFIDFVDEMSATRCLESTRNSVSPSTLLTYAKK